MTMKTMTAAALAALIAATPATRAAADAKEFIGGLVVGGLVGHLATKEAQRRQQAQRPTATRQPVVTSKRVVTVQPSAARLETRDVQKSLNYFGFNAGSVDGVKGRRTRAAISDFQAYMGYPATGQLTDFEKDFLLASYDRAILNGSSTGSRAILGEYRDDLIQSSGEYSGSGKRVPNFGLASADTSLTTHCDSIGLITRANGGPRSLSTLTDARFALNEQFCAAREDAIEDGEILMQQVSGLSARQVADQCGDFGGILAGYVAQTSTEPADAVLRDVASFATSTGQAPAALASSSRICLAEGYKADDMNTAMGSALMLTALGEDAYGELLGHHLLQGIGADQRTDLAGDWYEIGFDALEDGEAPVFGIGEPGRGQLVRAAVYDVVEPNGANAGHTGRNTLPTFTVSNN